MGYFFKKERSKFFAENKRVCESKIKYMMLLDISIFYFSGGMKNRKWIIYFKTF